jgi:hypothetical protein
MVMGIMGPKRGKAGMTTHRYTLRRQWIGGDGIVNFIMLSPSTADDVLDDATIRRCVGFGKRWGFNGLTVTNLFAYRATHLFAYRATQPKDLKALLNTIGGFHLAIGEDNTAHIDREAKRSKMVVCAWGDNCDVLPHRDLDVIQMLRFNRDLYCIRRTARGNPAHPVRERYTDAPVIFYPQL